MTIEVEIAGTGQIAEFPDGTPPEVIQQALAGMAQPQEQTLGQTLTGAADIAGTAVAGLGKEAIEGLSGLGGVIAGRPVGEAVASAQALTSQIPDVQLGEQGQALVQSISDRFQAAPEMVKEIVNAVSTLGPSIGEATFQATGSPALATAAEVLPGALEAATGLRAPKAVGGAVGQAADVVAETAEDVFKFQTPAKKRIGELIKSGSTDIDTARFRLDGQKVKRDKPAIDAIKQGFDEGVIADLKQAKPQDIQAMKKMVNIVERGKKSARFSATNRPSDVLGDSLMKRVRIVKGANKAAGQQLDSVAKSLKGQSVESAPIGESFITALDDMGISVGNDLKLDFSGSDIEGLSGPEQAVSRIFNRMKGPKQPDAFELHRLKRFIDEQVTFGKNAEGLSGRTEGVLKSLRRDIDQTLDANFPEYDRINTAYAETIGALDAIQDVAGKKMNLTGPNADKATGTLMRRILSNAQSRVTLLDSVTQIEDVAKKFESFRGKLDPTRIEGPSVSKIKDDLLSQTLFVDELEAVFGPSARTSLQGQVKQGVKSALSPGQAAVDIAAEGLEKVRGINEQGAFKAIKTLLGEQ